jgi:hypothetical protein
MTRLASKGKCILCEASFSKAGMTRHLEACMRRKPAPQMTRAQRRRRNAGSFHLVVEGRYLPEYWMHLLAPAHTTLADLDDFLRSTWLECCGHLSAFTIEGTTYTVYPMEDYADGDMGVALRLVLPLRTKFDYEYDFGTTTRLALRAVSEWEGEAEGKTIQLLARNDPPRIECVLCGEPATQVCTQCIHTGEGWLCTKCAPEHECGEDMFLPVVNSPRVGMCAYTG